MRPRDTRIFIISLEFLSCQLTFLLRTAIICISCLPPLCYYLQDPQATLGDPPFSVYPSLVAVQCQARMGKGKLGWGKTELYSA